MQNNHHDNDVLRVKDIQQKDLTTLLARYALRLELTSAMQPIPGSFWGDEEAGLIADTLYARANTPLHSVLHEACHFICMTPQRRQNLDTNAGGDYAEENGVCYLQILLSDHLPGLNKNRMLSDMDAWGYSFRLGSALKWFAEDAEDARNWLIENEIINESDEPLWRLRGA